MTIMRVVGVVVRSRRNPGRLADEFHSHSHGSKIEYFGPDLQYTQILLAVNANEVQLASRTAVSTMIWSS